MFPELGVVQVQDLAEMGDAITGNVDMVNTVGCPLVGIDRCSAVEDGRDDIAELFAVGWFVLAVAIFIALIAALVVVPRGVFCLSHDAICAEVEEMSEIALLNAPVAIPM